MAKILALTTEAIRETTRVRSLPAGLPLEAINIFERQMRETYSNIQELAESIVNKGQLQQGIAAALTPREAKRFIRDLNDLWGANFHILDMVRVAIDGTSYYIVLVAGHRRYKACQIARLSIPELRYRVELRFGMTAEDALSVQFTENMHERVLPHEEARAIALSWKWLKKRHPEYTMAQFARTLNRTGGWVSNALRFVTLPDDIQVCADDKRLAYGVLVQIARLCEGMRELEKPLPDAELRFWVTNCIIHRHDEKEVRARVTKYLFDTANEQADFFGTGGYDDRPLRRIVAEHLIRGLLGFIEYLEVLHKHRDKGGFLDESYFDPETDEAHVELYSMGSPLRILERATLYLESELPHFEELASKHGGRHRKAIGHGIAVTRRARQLVSRIASAEPRSMMK